MKCRCLTLMMMLALAAFPACRKDKASTSALPAAAHVAGTPHTDEVLNAWRNAGLAPDGFAPVQPAPNGAAFCEHGLVRGVDTTVCEFASDDGLKRGTQLVKEGWARADVHTGVVLSAKRTAMVAIDRERREPSGKTIGQMAKIFSKL
jgi:hypothetical protein